MRLRLVLVVRQECLDVYSVGIDEVVLQDVPQAHPQLEVIISQRIQDGEVEGLMSEALLARDGAPPRSLGGLRAGSL